MYYLCTCKYWCYVVTTEAIFRHIPIVCSLSNPNHRNSVCLLEATLYWCSTHCSCSIAIPTFLKDQAHYCSLCGSWLMALYWKDCNRQDRPPVQDRTKCQDSHPSFMLMKSWPSEAGRLGRPRPPHFFPKLELWTLNNLMVLFLLRIHFSRTGLVEQVWQTRQSPDQCFHWDDVADPSLVQEKHAYRQHRLCSHKLWDPCIKENCGDLRTSRLWARWPHILDGRCSE